MSSSVETPLMARKAYSYIRFSGKRQEAGDSYRRQEAMAEEAAKEEGIALDQTLSLADRGVSAFRGQNWKRGYLGKFLDLVDAGIVPKGSVLIIERVNRLSRLPWMEQVELWKEILRRGIIIRTCEPPSRYSAQNMNELAVGCPVVLFMMLGHQESQQKSQWVKAVWGEKKRQAQTEGIPHGRMRPGWLDVITEPHPKNPARIITRGYRLNAEHVQTVRWIFQQAIAGTGLTRIGRQLREQGVPCFQRTNWSPGCIRNILASRTAIGEYQPTIRDENGKPVPFGRPLSNYYPAAVTEEEFNAAQAALRSRRGKGGRQGGVEANLFTHIAFEAETGVTLHCQVQTRSNGRWKYLSTPDRRQIVPYQAFEDATLNTIAHLKAKDVDGRHEADSLTARVESLQAERSRLGHELDALDQQIRELPPERWPKRVVARMAELDEMIARKDEELRAAKEAANTSGRTDALAELKSSMQLLDEVKGTAQEMTIRQRIKMRLHLIVEAIWLKVQNLNKQNRFVHCRLYLHGGESRYYVFKLGRCGGALPDKELPFVDFRADFLARQGR